MVPDGTVGRIIIGKMAFSKMTYDNIVIIEKIATEFADTDVWSLPRLLHS